MSFSSLKARQSVSYIEYLVQGHQSPARYVKDMPEKQKRSRIIYVTGNLKNQHKRATFHKPLKRLAANSNYKKGVFEVSQHLPFIDTRPPANKLSFLEQFEKRKQKSFLSSRRNHSLLNSYELVSQQKMGDRSMQNLLKPTVLQERPYPMKDSIVMMAINRYRFGLSTENQNQFERAKEDATLSKYSSKGLQNEEKKLQQSLSTCKREIEGWKDPSTQSELQLQDWLNLKSLIG